MRFQSLTPAMEAVRETLLHEGLVLELFRAGCYTEAIAHIEETIRAVCRSRSEELALDPTDHHLHDRLAQRILQHPVFAFAEKETMLGIVGAQDERAALDAILARADQLVRFTAQGIALALAPTTTIQ